MKYLKQFGIIMAVSFIGEILNAVLPLPIPAGIYGIVLLFILLETKIVPLSAVKETGNFLIDIMPVMLVPAAVELMDYWGIVKPQILKYIIATVVSTIVVMVVSGLVTQGIIRLRKKAKTE
ncbi:MAG: CidA/LrgA family protein [Oscillospiraceae bacterium]